ncbi:MAG TPA: hypothetical protein VH560_16155, partial [Polyangia bacterium]|nr:hypothetical protein [Polyangia bacterium]
MTMSRPWVAAAAVVLALGAGSIARAATSDTEDDTQDEAKTSPAPSPKAKAAPKRAAKQDTTTSEVKADTSNADDSKPGDAKSGENLDAKASDAKASDAKADDAKGDDSKADETDNEKPVPVAAKPNRPLSVEVNGWKASVYGFAELDFMQDSTQSYVEGSGNTTLARPNTLAGDNPRSQMTARNSRFAFMAAAPEMNGIKASSVLEMDFFGNQPVEATQNDFYTNGPLRMRLFYLKLETPIVDVIAGQYHDLFAWGSFGFYPNTDAFLPTLGEVYHRNPQLRLTKTLHAGAVDLQVAVAAVRPAGRDSGYPDGQGGVRLAVLPWEGANTQGAGRPIVAPMALGISGIVRRLSVNDFSATPSNPQTATAWGVAGNLFLPIIPARGQDMSNAISVTIEGTMGTGISDLYPGLTGGVGFPQLPNPNNDLAVPTYIPNIDAGIATFDGSALLQTVNWQTVVGNLQYHLPIADGKKLWISGTYSFLRSTNVAQLVPQAGRPYAWNKGQYADGNLWLALTQAVQLGLSAQWTQQTFLDGVQGANLRGEG